MNAKELIEKFAQKQGEGFYPCPRCGRMAMDKKPTRNALSRRATVYVCNDCGMEEALEDMAGTRVPLDKWDIVQDPARWRMDAPPQRMVLTHIGRDSWDRPVYESAGKLYVDVNPMSRIPPEICTKSGNSFDGEPEDPIPLNQKVEFLPHRDTWD